MLIDVQQVSLERHGKQILDQVSLSVDTGEIVTIIGPNGAGKSTLIKLILDLVKPTSGTVVRKAGIRIGYMPQKLAVESLMPLDVFRFLQLSPRSTKEKCLEIAETVGVTRILNAPIKSISGGELQRVMLGRALLNQPDLLVLDEPAQGIDINGQSALYGLIASMREKITCGIIMVSHDLHLVIAGTDKVICLNQHVCCSGHPATITQHPEFIQLFGENVSSGLAVYTHKHDHDHN